MSIRIALAGNPNSGKTTLFNALTGSNQFVGNWPGVTVEKKEGKLKKHDNVKIIDLPGIYSLSPYTLEEVVARNYLMDEKPDAILNIVDGTNLERNLYLTTQLAELGIPVVVAVNMMDVVRKNGDKIDIDKLSKAFNCKVIEISALKGENTLKAAEAAVEAASKGRHIPRHEFSGPVEHALAHIEEACLHESDETTQRWYAVKIFERDSDIIKKLGIDDDTLSHIEKDIQAVEAELDDDAESIITNERYVYIGSMLKGILKKQKEHALTTSDKIDRVVTNRWLALPIFALVMFIVYYVSITTVGTWATDWANDGVFGDGWHLTGAKAYEEHSEAVGTISSFAEFTGNDDITELLDPENEEYDEAEALKAVEAYVASVDKDTVATLEVENDEDLSMEEVTYTYDDLQAAYETFKENGGKADDPAEFGTWVPGIPVLIERGLDAVNCAPWLKGLILDGIVAGVGAVLGFVPQMLVLFLFLAFLEACGYMARIAFVMDRIFRKFGLSGKSFIPYLIGTGCGIPGIMASRTIENERDRRMTIMTTTFMPCGAKLPFIAMIAGAIFGNSALIGTSAYFLGMASIIVSGICLKKTRMFAGDPAPFVMELPAYHWPTVSNVLRSMWERGWSFIKKAGTIILLSTILIWFLTFFGFVDGTFTMLEEDQIDHSLLAAIGGGISWIFTPLGWGNWQASVASITGLVAKENIVGTMGIIYGAGSLPVYAVLAREFTKVTAYSFLAFNLLCAPCFAAIGAIKREMNNRKWTWFAILYQCGFAYAVAICINQIGGAFTGALNIPGLMVSIALIAFMFYMLFRPYRESQKYAAA